MTPTFASPPQDKAELESGPAFTPRFDEKGLITVVVTDARDGELLMVAHMNAEALSLTLETGIAHDVLVGPLFPGLPTTLHPAEAAGCVSVARLFS